MLRRRDWIVGATSAAALPGCSRRRHPAPRVTIVRAPGYTSDLYNTVRRMLADHKPSVHGKRVVLKPNLVEFDPSTAINTNPMLVHAAFEAFRSLGASEVRIAEGPANRRNTLELAEAAGYFDIIPRFGDLFTDLNLDEIRHIEIPHPASRLSSLYLPVTALDCDLLVSMPKMKTHHWAGATLSMKNLFGLVPGAVYGWPKNILHWAGIDGSIADLHSLFPRTFALVDGIVAMEGNGPIQGTAKRAGVLVAGTDPIAVDATCCRIMALDPQRIEYLRLRATGQLEEAGVRQSGEPIAAVQTRFELIPELESFRLGS